MLDISNIIIKFQYLRKSYVLLISGVVGQPCVNNNGTSGSKTNFNFLKVKKANFW